MGLPMTQVACTFGGQCRPMINKPPPFKGLNIRIPILIPIKGRGFLNQGSGLPCYPWSLAATKLNVDGVAVKAHSRCDLLPLN